MTTQHRGTRSAPRAVSRECRVDVARLRRDVEHLVGVDRRTTGAGERESARYLADRLTEHGVEDITTTTFRSQSSWAPAHLVHLALGAGAAVLPRAAARWVGVAVAISYELEVSGRLHWARRVLPARRGVSVWGTIPARGSTRRTLVLSAHHDAAHVGWMWHPRTVAASRRLARSTGRALPSHAVPLVALAATALPGRQVRIAAGAVLTASAALVVQSMRSPTAPGANDNASGVAAVLELTRQFAAARLPDTAVTVVFPGGEEAGNAGITHWLRATRREPDPGSNLAINLDAVGSAGELVVSRHEALTNRLAETAVRRAVRAAHDLNVPLKQVTFPNTTDAAIMTMSGLPAVSLLSLDDGWAGHLHRPSDTVDNVDWETVANAVRLAHRVATTWADETSRGKRAS